MDNNIYRNILSFDIPYLQYLQPDGTLNHPLPSHLSTEDLLRFYRTMLFIRLFDKRTINLHRTGKMGTFPASYGQEAVMAGVGFSLNDDDIYCPYYRDHGVIIARGGKPDQILNYWGGDERGSDASTHPKDFPICITIGCQCLHAAGVAFSFRYRQEKRAVVSMIGDGGTSEGDFYEAMNFSGAKQLPIVFIVNNNQWAISVPLKEQTNTETIAQKGIAAGINAVQVDGNDVFSVYTATQKALHDAREHNKPHLIEAITYRLGDHTTLDNASRYRSTDETIKAEKLEPLQRLEHYLMAQHLLDDQKKQTFTASCQEQVDLVVEQYLNQPPAPATDIIDYLYETLPHALYDQRDEIGQYQ